VVKKFGCLFTGISIFGMWGLIYAVSCVAIYQMFPQTFAQQQKALGFNGAYEKITKIGFFFLATF
jgi:hypothetical protein